MGTCQGMKYKTLSDIRKIISYKEALLSYGALRAPRGYAFRSTVLRYGYVTKSIVNIYSTLNKIYLINVQKAKN